jgi:hypothetical protein
MWWGRYSAFTRIAVEVLFVGETRAIVGTFQARL